MMLSLPTPDSRVGPADSGAGVPSARQSALRRKAGRSGVSEGPTPLCSTQPSLTSFTSYAKSEKKKDRRSRGFVFVRRAYPQTPRNVALGTRRGVVKNCEQNELSTSHSLGGNGLGCHDGGRPSSPAMHMTIPRRALQFLIFFLRHKMYVCVRPSPFSQS